MAFVLAEDIARDLEPDLFVIINRGRLLTEVESEWRPLSERCPELGECLHQHFLGTLDGKHCFALFFNEKDEPRIDGYCWTSLRSHLGLISDELFHLAGRALQLTRWFRNHQFCGVCGSATRPASSDRALVCKSCKTRYYPRISPCVIGLVCHENRCILAQGVRHPQGLYSTLAGFIEPGESAEQAFAREVFEEVGVRIKNIQYFGSQPWHFPGQLMIGFIADYESGELSIDEKEIVDARWFAADELPNIPPQSTIAGQIIDHFVCSTQKR